MRISDWSSDVCSSDLDVGRLAPAQHQPDAVPRIRLLRHSPARPDAIEHRPLDAEPQRTETCRPLAARAGPRAPGGQAMSAKANILAKLKKSLEGTTPIVDDYDVSLVTQPWSYAPEQRIARLRQLMEAVHTEIHLTTDADWPALLEQLLHDRQLPSLLIAPTTPYGQRSEEHTSELQSLMRISYAVFCLKKKKLYITS